MANKARIVVQQVEHADLLVDNVDKWEHIDKGIIVYVCFLQGIVPQDVEKIVKDILESNIAYSAISQKVIPPLAAGSDIMIIPQASIAGKIKDKKLQFHALVGKADGQAIYDSFVQMVGARMKEITGDVATFVNNRVPVLVGGTYSNRQGLKFSAYGPSTNVFDF